MTKDLKENALWIHLSWAPIALFALAIGVFYWLDIKQIKESYALLILFNLFFSVPVAILVCHVASRSYILRGGRSLLFMGSGMLAWGISSALRGLVAYNVNSQLTFHNIGVFLAGLGCLTSAISAFKPGRFKETNSPPSEYALAISYIAVMVFMLFIGWAVTQNFLPPFFVPGQGVTLLRKIVLGAAIIQFLTSAVIFRIMYIRSRLNFFHWYSLGLTLFAIGLLGVWLTIPGTPLNWIARSAQFTAGPYILIAVLSVRRRLSEWNIPFEKALHESEEKYRELIETSNSIIMKADKDLNITYMNEFGLRFFGYTARELLGKNVIGTTIPKKDDAGNNLIDMAERIKKHPENFSTNVHKNMRKNGQLVWVSWTNKVKYDKDGNLAEILAVGNDLSELRKVEGALRESEERFSAFMDNSPGIAWIKDEQGRYLYLNKAHEARFGVKLEDCRGKTDFDLWPPEVARVFRDNDLAVLCDGKPRQVIEEARDRDGTKSYWFNSKFLIYDVAGHRYAAGHGVDITERKRAEEIMKRDKDIFEKQVAERTQELVEANIELEHTRRLSDIGMLAATVAHELRNPLAAISIAAHNIKNKAKNPNLDSHLSNIEKKVNESDQIINNLLFYSRLKPPHYEKINLFDTIKECADILKKMDKKGITLFKDLDAIKDIVIEADQTQIKEVFNNLMNNAYDAVSLESGKIDVTAENKDKFIKMVIEDNGHGISNDIINKVFDPFFTTKAKGVGLGLTVCRQIARMHRGDIELKSEEGKGTSAIVRLPKKEKKIRIKL